MKRLLLILLAVLGLSACAGVGEPASAREISFKCSDGKPYRLSFLRDKNQAELLYLTLPEGKQITLVNVVAASGIRYVGSTYEWWGKGNTAMFTHSGSTLNCKSVQN